MGKKDRDNSKSSKMISVCVPCYNEVGNVKEMADTLLGILEKLTYRYELIFTDNFSTDGTRELLRGMAADDSRIKVLLNNRNYGIDGRSGRNTFRNTSGDVIITIPCDFQEPPELIPEFVSYWEQGYKVVCGQKNSSEEGRLKYGLRQFFYRIINSLSEIPQYPNISGITLLDRAVMDEFLKTDYDFYLRYALADMGYEVKLIPYKQKKRKSGRSSYNLWRYLSFAINSMITTSSAPLMIMTVSGILLSVLSFAIGMIYLVLKLIFWYNFQAGTAPLLIGMFFLGALQLFFIGLLGEYVNVILRKVTHRPDVIVKEKLNFDTDDKKDP